MSSLQGMSSVKALYLHQKLAPAKMANKSIFGSLDKTLSTFIRVCLSFIFVLVIGWCEPCFLFE